jgi:hypothetical protein
MANGEKLIQTLVPAPLAAWVKKQADKEGLSVSAWIRRLVMQSREAASALRKKRNG